MSKTFGLVVIALGFVGQAWTASAQDAPNMPDLKGRWVGTSESLVLGEARHHGGSHATPTLSSVEFTVEIDGQDGRRFWGAVSSKGGKEPLLGVIGFDGKAIVARDSDGSLMGAIVDRDTIELTYSHSGASVVVAATRFKRQK